MLEVCGEVAEVVGESIESLLGTKKAGEISRYGASGYTKVIDRAAEEAALRVLEKSRIPMVVLSEEAGRVSLGERPKYVCVLDPLDGSYNAIHGISIYALSIAFARYKRAPTLEDIEVGLVKNLATGDVYEAEKGKGAKLNGKNISTTRDEKLEGASLCVYIHRDVRRLEKLLKMPKRVRTLGCVALEMCHVAKGDYHAMVDLRKVLRVTDIAAGKLIVEEAGGIVSDGLGQPLRASILEIERTSPIASGNIGIHKKILNVLR